MTAIFCIAQKSFKKIFSQDLKLGFILIFNIAVEKFDKKNNLVELELSKEIFLSPEYPDFGSKF